jgi:hypothetical protein
MKKLKEANDAMLVRQFGNELQVRMSRNGYMEGLGYLTMSEADCREAETVELIVNWNQETSDSLSEKISFVSYHQKMWVVAKHSKKHVTVVLGIRDPKFFKPEDMSRIMDASMWP